MTRYIVFGSLPGLGIVGLVLLFFGARTGSPFCTSIGGALIGTSLGAFVGWLAEKGLSEDIKQTVREFLAPGFTTDHEISARFQVKWHMYHVTRMDGRFVWRYAIIDFQKTKIPGRLIAEERVSNKTGGRAVYRVEGGVRDARLVTFHKDKDSDEPSAVFVFPFAGDKSEGKSFGISFHKTFDIADYSISPAFFSREPLCNVHAEGTVPEDTGRELDTLWQKMAQEGGNHLLPRINIRPSKAPAATSGSEPCAPPEDSKG